jgi:tRNA(fMet)-specific endonuclease VapC
LRLLLDTNAYSKMRRGQQDVAQMVRAASHLYLSSVVVGELLYGFRHGNRHDENLASLESFAAQADVTFIPVSWETAIQFGRVACSLRQKGTPIPLNDIWVAAHVFETGAQLVSFDGHFQHVEGLFFKHLVL